MVKFLLRSFTEDPTFYRRIRKFKNKEIFYIYIVKMSLFRSKSLLSSGPRLAIFSFNIIWYIIP